MAVRIWIVGWCCTFVHVPVSRALVVINYAVSIDHFDRKIVIG